MITDFNQTLDMLQISGLSDTSTVQVFVNSATEALVFFNGFEAITVQSNGPSLAGFGVDDIHFV